MEIILNLLNFNKFIDIQCGRNDKYELIYNKDRFLYIYISFLKFSTFFNEFAAPKFKLNETLRKY